jgi:hypothetical protein
MANIELDGANKKIKVDSGDLTLDVPGDIILDADGADLVFADGGTNILKVTNSSSDVVFQPQVDAKDIIFKQYDGTTVATVEDNGTFNIPTDKLAINGTAVTSTAAELNILDGVTSTAAELNILDGVTSTAAELNIVDGNTSATSTTIADADRVVLNDNGTMVQAAVTDLKTYIGGFDVSSITGATDLAAIPDNADEFVMSDGGTLKRIDYKYLVPYGSLAGNFSHGNQTGISSFSYTKILLSSANYNRGLTFGSNKITIPTGGAGDYMVSVTMAINLYGSDKLQAAKAAIYINGSGSKYFGNDFRDNPGRDAHILYNDVIQFNDDDEIEIYAYIGHTQSTSSYQAANSTHVTLFKINNA